MGANQMFWLSPGAREHWNSFDNTIMHVIRLDEKGVDRGLKSESV